MQAEKFGCQFKCFQGSEMEHRALHAAVLTEGLQTARVHPLQAPTSDTGTATRCICKQTLVFLLPTQFSVALLQTGFGIGALQWE